MSNNTPIFTYKEYPSSTVISVDVEINKVHWDKAFNEVLKKDYKDVKVPGFREINKLEAIGKMPKFKTEIEGKLKESFHREAILEYLQQYTKLKTVGNAYDIEFNVEEKTLKFKIAPYPEINIEGIDTAEYYNAKPISEETAVQIINDCTTAIENQLKSTVVLAKQDREVRSADVVLIDVAVHDEDQDTYIVKDYECNLSDLTMFPDIHKALVGKNKGDQFEATIAYDMEPDNVEVDSIDIEATITINGVYETEKVEVIDLAKRSGYKTAEEFVDKLNQLKLDKELAEMKHIIENNVINTLVNKLEFTVPTKLIELTAKDYIKSGKFKPDPNLEITDKNAQTEKLLKTVYPEVKESIIVDHLGEEYGINVPDQDVIDYARQKANDQITTDENMMNLVKGGMFDDLYMDLKRSRVADHLYNKLSPVFISPEAKALLKL